jgi:hypothetical protein
MRGVLRRQFTKNPERVAMIALMALTTLCLFSTLSAQQQGPMKPPAGMPAPPIAPQPKPAPAGPAQASTPKAAPSAASNEPPPIPIDEIIQRFAARESEFKTERDNFTYTQTFIMQTLDDSNRVDGEYRLTSEIVFTPQGKRFENVTFAPPPTLERLTLSQQDLDDLEHVQPFVLTTTELPKYNIKYVDHEPLDELNTYVFDVGPKTLEKNQRYFQGRIWVDDKDFAIVKTDGKAVPDIVNKKKGQENLFPRFETFRENVEGSFWFPTYTRSDDVLRFSSGPIHIRMTVRYENYKRFGVTIKIGAPTKKDKDQDKP